MIALEHLADLVLSAASGVVARGDELYIVADDELSLGCYGWDGAARGGLRLLRGELPAEPAKRKKEKADFEAIVVLGDGRVLVLGSGSKERRRRGVLLEPRSSEEPVAVDLAPLYERLAQQLDRVNVEGAATVGDELVLLTRRTGRRGANLLVRLDMKTALDELSEREPSLGSRGLLGVVRVELGSLDGVPLGFTDATCWDDRALLFTAAAESTDDPVDDGVCAGSTIGLVDLEGAVLDMLPARPAVKLEGVCVLPDGSPRFVVDPDDRARRASLYTAALPFRARRSR